MGAEELTRGELQTALSNAMVRVHREHYGKGAARARTLLFDEYVFTVLEDVFTVAERALKAGDAGELICEMRLTFQDMMTPAFVEPVEALTERTVVGYHSSVDVEHESALEFFVLGPGRPAATDPESAAGAGTLRTAISNAVARLLSERYGRGAARTRTYVNGRHVFCALEGVLTTVERTLVDGGERDVVRRVRRRFHELHGAAFEEQVAALTGRRVAGSQAQVLFDPDTLFLVFLLDETE